MQAALSSNIVVGLGASLSPVISEIASWTVRNQTASRDASWNASNSAWFVEVAVTVCFVDRHDIGAPFLTNI